MSQDVFSIKRPLNATVPVLFASPHSGANYTDSFRGQSVLDPLTLRSSEDAFVDDLFAGAVSYGAALMAAHMPRAYVDLNRDHTELDPAVIDGLGKTRIGARTAAGLGVIARVVAGGRSIYRGKISKEDAQRRIDDVWTPYHAALEAELQALKTQFGQAILIDCHSMPHKATDGRNEIIIGDLHGNSAAAHIVADIEHAFAQQGFQVARNMPFAGAYILERHSNPGDHIHAVQIEIDRSLYMTEKTLEPSGNYDAVKARITQAIAQITERLMPQLAAE